MSDYTLCVWTERDCPRAAICYRHTNEFGKHGQSYFTAPSPGEACEYFIPNDKGKEDKS